MYLLFVLMIIHAMIHFVGFAKGYNYRPIPLLTNDISRPEGALWLIVAILFGSASCMLLLKKDMWCIMALVAVVISQLLIVLSWRDAKFGTLANLLILAAILAAFM